MSTTLYVMAGWFSVSMAFGLLFGRAVAFSTTDLKWVDVDTTVQLKGIIDPANVWQVNRSLEKLVALAKSEDVSLAA